MGLSLIPSKMKVVGIVLLSVLGGSLLVAAKAEVEEKLETAASSAKRDEKLFSLFNVVTFKNLPCTSNSGSRNGTCYTSSECSNVGGQAAGNCASGFGVCCIFVVSAGGSTIDQNCTYIQNPGYPTAYSLTTAVAYTVKKQSNCEVCALRLDFVAFQILGPSDTKEASGGACQDSFVLSVPSSLSSPTICGLNTGEHLYIDMGTATGTTAALAFTFATTASTVRTWEIKATQIPCNSRTRPPSGCQQYHLGANGIIKSFNFDDTAAPQHLASQKYNICIRPEENMCCIEYKLCSWLAATTAWQIDAGAIALEANIDHVCTEDYIGIEAVMASCTNDPGAALHSRMCGDSFNLINKAKLNLGSVCDCTKPFNVEFVTDATTDAIADQPNRGLCLEYNQVSC